MEKKSIKYLIILLVIPLIISLLIAIFNGDKSDNINSYNSINGETYGEVDTTEERIKSSNTFIYLSVFCFVVLGAGVWVYVKKKGNV